MAVTSFEVDERTATLLAQLQDTFGVKTNAAVSARPSPWRMSPAGTPTLIT